METEEVLRVGPDLDRLEAASLREVLKLADAELIGVFGVNRLALGEANRGAVQRDDLGFQTDDVHLDPSALGIVESAVTERREIEVGVELLVDALEQVQIESRRDLPGIVVGGMEPFLVLLEIDADEQRTAGPDPASRVGQERDSLAGAEVADRGAGEEDHLVVQRSPLGRGQGERDRVVRAHGDDFEPRVGLGQPLAGLDEMLSGNIDRDIGHVALQGVQQDSHFIAAAAAVLDQQRIPADEVGDLPGAIPQNQELRSRGVVLAQPGNPLEQLRAALVVEELGRYPLRLVGEASEHDFEEIIRLRVVIVELDTIEAIHGLERCEGQRDVSRRRAGCRKTASGHRPERSCDTWAEYDAAAWRMNLPAARTGCT